MSKRTPARQGWPSPAVGETTYYKHGQAPVSEFKLALQAILGGLRGLPASIPAGSTGFRFLFETTANDPSRLAAALGLPALRSLQHELGAAAAVGGFGPPMGIMPAAAVACRHCQLCPSCSVPWRRGQFQRFRRGAGPGGVATGEAALNAPYGVMSPAPALRHAGDALSCTRTRSRPSAQRAIALRVPYHHAQANPARGDARPGR